MPLARLAWKESRSARRRLLLYMSSISLGAAALVAIDSFAANVTRSVREQSRTLLGGDIAVTSRQPLVDSMKRHIDTLERVGFTFARVTGFPSMAVVPRTTGTRLVQVRGVSDNYPVFGEITTRPAGIWKNLTRGPHALVDPSLLTALEARVGDTLTLGFGRFTIIGTVDDVPGSSEITELIGPRVFIPEKYVAETQLLVFGSTASFRYVGKARNGLDVDKSVKPLRPMLRKAQVRLQTASESEAQATRAILQLRNFIGVVGLVALLLGGIGVASGVRAFVARKIDTVAILRCLGASGGQVLAMYVAQAAAMGLVGAAAGAVLGVAVQFALPGLMSDFLPVDVAVTLEPAVILTGIAVGGWIALLFSLRPLLTIRNISPLQTLRREVDSEILRTRWRDIPRWLVDAALVASVVGIALTRTTRVRDGIGIGVATIVVVLVLVASAALVSYLAKKLLRKGWPYVFRQGVANLYRPANQTAAVTVALGFGAFLVTTLILLQANMQRQFTLDAAASRANVVFYDVQSDQADSVGRIIQGRGNEIVQTVPVVTMRISAINNQKISDLDVERSARSDSGANPASRAGAPNRAGWALRREYRSTYRDRIAASEKLTSGKWFSGAGNEVSMEEEVAKDLKLRLGDVITWNVQGAMVKTRVTSFREVSWARFEPNFFAVFSPAALKDAPMQHVVLALATKGGTSQLQRAIVDAFPNVSSFDLSLIRDTVKKIVDKVTVAIRFMALFSLVMGVPVLFSSIAATRRDRIREGVLLKTLGATRGQIIRILLSEYAILGILGSLTGMVLAFGGGWALARFVFEDPFVPAIGPALAIAGLMLTLTVSIGLLAGRDVYRETPMSALRET